MKPSRILRVLRTYDFKTYNWRLILYVVVLSIIGILAISSATDDVTTVNKQIAGLIAGFIIMLFLSLVKFEVIARYYWLMYFAAVILLVLVLTPLGVTRGGAQRWITIGVQVQPSEVAKILLIIFFSAFLVKNQQVINSWKFLLITALLALIPLALVFKEPDLSTTIVIFMVICAIIFTSSLLAKYLLKIIAAGVVALIVIVALIAVLPADSNIISEYQYNRIVGFYDSDNEEAADIRYQQENSVLAIASGGLTGKGLNNNSITSVKNADFISEPETDFIFTIIGEELGFVGSMATVVLLFLIVFECFRMGLRAREQIGRSTAIGFGSLIAFQSFINLGVVTMIIPNTGLTLPFVSAGLSSLVMMFVGVGLVLNIGLRMKVTF